MKAISIIDKASWILSAVGAVNWGLVSAFDVNVVSLLLKEGSVLAKAAYILVGLSGLWSLYGLTKCSSSGSCK